MSRSRPDRKVFGASPPLSSFRTARSSRNLRGDGHGREPGAAGGFRLRRAAGAPVRNDDMAGGGVATCGPQFWPKSSSVGPRLLALREESVQLGARRAPAERLERTVSGDLPGRPQELAVGGA